MVKILTNVAAGGKRDVIQTKSINQLKLHLNSAEI